MLKAMPGAVDARTASQRSLFPVELESLVASDMTTLGPANYVGWWQVRKRRMHACVSFSPILSEAGKAEKGSCCLGRRKIISHEHRAVGVLMQRIERSRSSIGRKLGRNSRSNQGKFHWRRSKTKEARTRRGGLETSS